MNVIRWFSAAAMAAFLLAPLAAQTRPPTTVHPAPAVRSPWFYLPSPPELVAGAGSMNARWSHDGRYALVLRVKTTMVSIEDIKMEPSIVLWNGDRKAATVLWRVESNDYQISEVTWMPGASVAYAVVAVNGPEGWRSTIWRIDARRATVAQVAGTGPSDGISISPRLPVAVIHGHDEQGSYIRTLDASGQMGAAVRLAEGAMFPLFWSSDGATFRLGATSVEGEFTTWSFDTSKGEATPIAAEPLKMPEERPEPRWPFRVEYIETNLAGASRTGTLVLPTSENHGEKGRSLWLVQGEGASAERIPVAADAAEWSISPRGDAILYTCREGCFVVPLIRISQAEAERAREKARQAILLNNGKQVALALMMHAMENDEVLPPAGTDLRTVLGPYVKSPEIFNGLTGPGDGFVYTFGGGPMSGVEDPANTEMGYIPAPGGRAVVFVDGHVVFEPSGAPRP